VIIGTSLVDHQTNTGCRVAMPRALWCFFYYYLLVKDVDDSLAPWPMDACLVVASTPFGLLHQLCDSDTIMKFQRFVLKACHVDFDLSNTVHEVLYEQEKRTPLLRLRSFLEYQLTLKSTRAE
jgi:hypothetical protein